MLQLGGVETAVFSPLFARKTQGPRNLRNHRKMVIADGTRLWAGGRNLAAEYFSGVADAAPWLDLTFDLQGPVAAAAASQFEVDWVAAGGIARIGGRQRFRTVGAATSAAGEAQFLPSGPDQSEDTVHSLLIDACFHARERMLAVTPYFVPDVSLETAMRLAARRGVQIDLCHSCEFQSPLGGLCAQPRAAVLEPGRRQRSFVALHEPREGGGIRRHRSALAGSVNLDSRSLLLNYECAVVFYGQGEINWLARWIEALIPKTAPV